ncbi:MAG: ATP-binding protein [Candidatus Daviesbacteria bacterium]|nr:ATP-binding protein [Candidatus Daviesbacteria bacterium]
MKPVQYVLCGLPFSGKTVLAKELEKRLGFARVSLDEIKFEHGLSEVSDDDVSAKEWDKIFDDLENKVIKYLKNGKSTLSETAWITKEWRERARKVADKEGFETKIIYVDTSPELVRKRFLENRKIKTRFDLPDNIFEEALRDFECPTSEENVINYHQPADLDIWIKENF